MESFVRGVIRFRYLILLACLVATVGFGMQLPKLYADDDVLQFLPAEDPDIKLFHRVNERFGGLDVAIIGLETRDVFTTTRLNEVRQLTRAVGGIDGVFDVLSFTEVPDPRPGMGGLEVTELVGSVPTNALELKELKQRVLANANARGNLVAPDGQAAMVLCFLGGDRPSTHVAADIKAKAESIWKGGPLYFGGSPFIRLFVAGGTKTDLNRLTPIVTLAVLLATFLMFRKPLGVALALGVVGIALIWVMGLIAARGGGLTIVGSALPTLLVAIGGTYGVQLLSAYFTGKSPTVAGRIAEAMRERGAPVVYSALTTVAGFCSLTTMDVEPMRQFGRDAAIGIALVCVFALTVVPAALSFSRRVPTRLGAESLAGPLAQVGAWSVRHRALALGVGLALGIASLFGIIRIAPDATMKSFFADNSEPDKANKFLERHFGGSVYLQVYFEGDLRSPFVLAELRKIVEFLRGQNEVVQVSSIIDPIAMMSEAMGGRPDLPLDREKTRSLYPFLDGSAAIDQIISPEKDAALVQIRLRSSDPDQVAAFVAELNAFIDKKVPRAVRGIEVAKLVGAQRAQRGAEMHRAVAERIIRLAKIYGGSGGGEALIKQVQAALESPEALLPGADLDQAIQQIVDEHILGEAAPFDEPAPELATLEQKTEWQQRGTLAFGALKGSAGQPTSISEVRTSLGAALPALSAADPEGLALTATAVANALDMARANVRSSRLAGPAIAAAGISAPSKELIRRVATAITDLDAPAFGLPDTSPDASRVMASVTGMPVINMAFCASTIRNQLSSLGASIAMVIIIVGFAFRSVVTAIKALVPSIVMLALSVGIMGAVHIPLDVTTTMIAAIALGVGVDYAIHYLWRRCRRGEDLITATAQVGPGIAANAFQVGVGFSMLALSTQVHMQRFGLLVALTMVLSAIATFLLLPALRAEGVAQIADNAAETPTPVPTVPQ